MLTGVFHIVCCFLFQAPVSAAGKEDLMLRNDALLEQGRYQDAVRGFMEMVLKNPDDALARQKLKQASELALQEKQDAVLNEKERLFAASDRINGEEQLFYSAKKKREAAWEKYGAKIKELSGSPDTVGSAVVAYSRLIETTPVYSDNRERNMRLIRSINDGFDKILRGKSAFLAEQKKDIDERDLASLFFSQESSADIPARYLATSRSQIVLNKLHKLKDVLPKCYDDMEAGMKMYTRSRYQEAIKSFRAALAFDAKNEEALFRIAMSEKLLKNQR